MLAYEFIARDRAGLALDQVDGEIEWIGTSKQHSEAEFQETFFLNEGFWPKAGNFPF